MSSNQRENQRANEHPRGLNVCQVRVNSSPGMANRQESTALVRIIEYPELSINDMATNVTGLSELHEIIEYKRRAKPWNCLSPYLS